MRRLDHAYASRTLPIYNLIVQRLHFCPMHLRPEMMFGVITIVEPGQVIEPAVGTYAPRNRLVRIAAIMAIVFIQGREGVGKIPKRPKGNERDVAPVKNTENHKGRNERHEFEHAPKSFAPILAF